MKTRGNYRIHVVLWGKYRTFGLGKRNIFLYLPFLGRWWARSWCRSGRSSRSTAQLPSRPPWSARCCRTARVANRSLGWASREHTACPRRSRSPSAKCSRHPECWAQSDRPAKVFTHEHVSIMDWVQLRCKSFIRGLTRVKSISSLLSELRFCL